MSTTTTVEEILETLESANWDLRAWPDEMRDVLGRMSDEHRPMLLAVIHIPLLLMLTGPERGSEPITTKAREACYSMLRDIAVPLRDMVYSGDKGRILDAMRKRSQPYRRSPRVVAILGTLSEYGGGGGSSNQAASVPIGDGISSLWRSNPLTQAPPPLPAYQSNSKALANVLSKQRQRRMDAQSDGVVHKNIGIQLAGGREDPVMAFDVSATERQRLATIDQMLNSPLQVSPATGDIASSVGEGIDVGRQPIRAAIANNPVVGFY